MIVKYSKKFPYAPYLNEDIGFEESIMDGASEEEILAALQRLSDVALKFHKANNPQLQDEPYTPFITPSTNGFEVKPPPVIDRKAIERMEILIDDAKTIEELAIYKEDAEKHGLKDMWESKNKMLDFPY